MSEPPTVALEPLVPVDQPAFRALADAYWQEIMPTADVVADPERRSAYFAAHWSRPDLQVFWAMAGAERVGFVAVTLDAAARTAFVEDFYVRADRRRQGYGAATVRALSAWLDRAGIVQVDLNVRRDTPRALQFWEAQGFRIASFRLRQYRDPATGTGFVGALSSDFAPPS